MVNLDEVFQILAKLMDDTVPAEDVAEDISELQIMIEEKLVTSMEQVQYAEKYGVIKKIQDICKDISLYLYFPELIHATAIAFHQPNAAGYRAIYKELLRERFRQEKSSSVIKRFADMANGTKDSYAISAAVPVIIHGNMGQTTIKVLNTAEKAVHLSDKEYLHLLDYTANADMDAAELAYVMSVSALAVGSHQVYMTIPPYGNKNRKYDISMKQAADVLVLRGKDYDAKALSGYGNLSAVFIYGKMPAADKALLKDQCARQGIRIEYFNSVSEVLKHLKDLHMQKKNNFCYRYYAQNVLYEIAWYLAVRVGELKKPMIAINDNLLYKDEVSKRCLKKLQKEYGGEIRIASQSYSHYKAICDELLMKIEGIQEKLGVREGIGCVNTHLRMGTVLLDLLIKMTCMLKQFPERNSRETIRYYCNLYKQATGKHEIANVLLNDFLEEPQNRDDLAVFRISAVPSMFFMRKKLDLRRQLSLSKQMCWEIVLKLAKPLRNIEKRMLGEYELAQGNREAAKALLYAAMTEGDIQAGTVLVKEYQLSFAELREAGDFGVASAAFRAGKMMYEKLERDDGMESDIQNGKDCLMYLNIAAAQNSLQALKLLGDIFYHCCSDDERKKENAKRALHYYLIVGKKGSSDKKLREKIGFLYLSLENYKEAVNYCEQADTAYSNYMLGAIYEQGLGCAADANKALDYYENAIQKGHVEAQVAYERLHAKLEAKKKKNVVSENTSYSSYTDYGGYSYSSGW